MIEPQNTMMPLPAESAPAELPHGETGFGEMLAQTLGMIPQIDPSVLQKIVGENGEQGAGADDLMAGGGSKEPGQNHAPIGRYVTLPLDGNVSVSAPVPVVTPPVVDTKYVDPVFVGDDTPVNPISEAETLVAPRPTHPNIEPVIDDGIWQPVLTDEPAAAVESTTTQPGPAVAGDGITQPVATDAAAGATTQPVAADAVAPPAPEAAPTSPVAEPTPVVAEPQPLPEPAPVSPQVPVDAVPVGDSPDPVAVEPVRNLNPVHNLQPVKPTRKVADPVVDRGLPTNPTPDVAEPRTNEATGMAKASTPPVVEPSVQLAPEAPVRFGESEVRVAVPNRVSVGEMTVPVDNTATPAPGGMTAMTTDAASQAAPVSNFSAPDAPAQNSALAERVIQAVQMQANQPPPRTMVVDIPEIEGLRLVVSVRAGAEVHVVPSTGSTATDGLQPFLDELQGVLENRGFVMTGDGRRRGNTPNQDEQPHPRRASQPTFRRPQPTDNDLRI